MDSGDKATRSRIMRAVRQRGTEPELALRRALHAAGLRFRVQRRDLPGTPDVVLPGRGLAVFVHGCFWHGHDCRAGRAPSTRTDYWGPKIEANRARDAAKAAALAALGWRVLTVWGCELEGTGATAVAARIAALSPRARPRPR